MGQRYDVIVVGGGMVGATLALLLAADDRRIAIVEGGAPPVWSADAPPDLRVSSVNLASQQVFSRAGAWPAMLARRAAPFRRLRVWDATGRGETLFNAGDAGVDAFGWFLENRAIQRSLWDMLERLPTVDMFCPAEPASLEQDLDEVRLKLRDGRVLAASLLVGADGARSAVRRLLGIAMPMHDYDQHALIVNAVTRLPQQDITWQRFTPTGPQAFLPLEGSCGSLVWYNSPDTVRRLLALPDERLMEAIEEAFPEELGGLVSLIGRASFPIRRGHAERYRGHRVVLVGDAAHVIHPLAGQGLNIGVQDAAVLAESIAGLVPTDGDVGLAAALARFEARRRPANLTMMVAMEAFHRIFAGPWPLLRQAGALGLGLANQIGPGKRLVMRHAMGLGSGWRPSP